MRGAASFYGAIRRAFIHRAAAISPCADGHAIARCLLRLRLPLNTVRIQHHIIRRLPRAPPPLDDDAAATAFAAFHIALISLMLRLRRQRQRHDAAALSRRLRILRRFAAITLFFIFVITAASLIDAPPARYFVSLARRLHQRCYA